MGSSELPSTTHTQDFLTWRGANLILYIFLSYIKGTQTPQCIFLNFKMRSKAGGELLPYCAVLTLGFSSKPKLPSVVAHHTFNWFHH